MAIVHKVKYAGKVHIGKYKDGVMVFDPPLPEKYLEDCNERMKSVIESGTFPGLNTDTTFLANRGTLDSQFEDKDLLDVTVKAAMKRGYKPKPTDVYLSGLADGVGDPAAFVNGNDAKGHIAKICKERGIGCRGSVNIPQPERNIDPNAAIKRDYEKAIAKRSQKSNKP